MRVNLRRSPGPGAMSSAASAADVIGLNGAPE
jgi:hypothetical protein